MKVLRLYFLKVRTITEARGLFAQVVVLMVCECMCPLSLAHTQGLSAHQACFPVCRAAWPALQIPGNYSLANQKTGEGFGQRLHLFQASGSSTVNDAGITWLYTQRCMSGEVCRPVYVYLHILYGTLHTCFE